MNIEISPTLADDLALRIGIAAKELIAREIEMLHERQLFDSIKAFELSDSGKVRAYFERTFRLTEQDAGLNEIRVTNEYLHKGLGISPTRMKKVRTALEDEGYITASFIGGGAIELRRFRPA